MEAGGMSILARSGGLWVPHKSRQQRHRVTTRTIGAAFPFMAQGSLGSRGVYIGHDLYGAGGFVYDPWELYPAIVTSPNMLVAGLLGKGKSALVKTYVDRQLVFGRRAFIMDPKDQGGQGEYTRLCLANGVQPLRLEPGGKVRLNPLDTTLAGGGLTQQQIRADQLRVLAALSEATLGRVLVPVERAAMVVALTAAAGEAAQLDIEPTIDMVAEALIHPVEAAAHRLSMERNDLLLAGRDVALELIRLCEGDLAGMFDGQTSGHIDFAAPLVCLDMSALYQSEALGILMVCAQAKLQRALMADRTHRRILVIDEGWNVLSNLAIARWMRYEIKLARAMGVQVILVIHRLSDLTAAGAADSEQVAIAKGMLSDTETQVIFAQHPAEVQKAKELLQLNTAQADLIPDLNPHVALFRVGRHSFEVRHRLLSKDEEYIVDTDERTAA
jgi:type IV secretory pathway VirB4 component